MRAVGVIGRCVLLAFGGGDDVGISLNIMLGKTIRGGLRRGRLEIVEIAVLLLIIGKAFSHVIEHVFCEILRLFAGKVFFHPFGVHARLVHAYKTYC